MRRDGFGWAIGSLVAALSVLVVTLSPFNFSYSFRSVRALLSIGIGSDTSPDIAENVLLFVPLGFALAAYFRYKGIRPLAAMVAVFGVSVVFSYVIEVLQLFLPSRFASLSDVLSNGVGGGLGFLAHNMWRRENARLAFATYLIAVCLLSLLFQWSTTVRLWDAAFPLVVGNERTGDRPWQGQVFDISILDRVITERQVSRLYHGETAFTPGDDSLVAWYDLAAPCPCHDASGHLPPLVSSAHREEESDEGAGQTGAPQWLETRGAARHLVERVKKTSRFTLVVTAATANRHQRGPARIVSLSPDISRRNFTLGQDGSDLVVRFQTPLTGINGSQPAFVVRDVFSTRARRHLVVTYDGRDLLVYVDGTRSRQAMRLGIGAAAFAPLLFRSPELFYVYDVLYHAIAFFPAGLLMSLAASTPRRRLLRFLALATGVAVCVLSLETILVMASGRVFSVSNLLWGLAFGSAGVVTGELRLSSHATPMLRKRDMSRTYEPRLS